MRRGRRTYPPAPARVDGRSHRHRDRAVGRASRPDRPSRCSCSCRALYDPRTEWPLMFAMHGGPPGSAAQARSGAERMLRVWADAAENAGWIVAAPALTPSVTAGARTEQRLPYELFHPEQARAVIAALRARYRINPDRLVSTGISLGSNYSIAFAASHPDWFSAIVPVSTEGDSRELLLRNLKTVPVYILEGSQDRNIRGISGPRALARHRARASATTSRIANSATAPTRASRNTTTMCCAGSRRGRGRHIRARCSACRTPRSRRWAAASTGSRPIRARRSCTPWSPGRRASTSPHAGREGSTSTCTIGS